MAARIHTDGTIDGSSDDKAGGAGTTVMPMPQPKHKVLPQGDIALSASQSAKLSTDLAARPSMRDKPSEAVAMQHKEETSIKWSYWIYGLGAGAVVTAGPVTLGILEARTTDIALWYQAWGPAIILLFCELGAASCLAPRVGYDMIEERSSNVSIKESMRSNLTTQGLVSALFLTIVCAMVQSEAPNPDDEFSVLNQWYVCLLVISLMLTMIGTGITIVCLLYVEPLNDTAAIRLVSFGVMYFGEPLAFSTMALCNTLAAMIIWTFGRYGIGAGIIGCISIFYAACRLVVVYSYFSGWKNVEIDQKMRSERREWGAQYVTTGQLAKRSPPESSAAGAIVTSSALDADVTITSLDTSDAKTAKRDFPARWEAPPKEKATDEHVKLPGKWGVGAMSLFVDSDSGTNSLSSSGISNSPSA